VLGADLASGSGKILTEGQIPQLLLAEAKGGATTTRGFSAIALGIAARDVQVESRPALVFETEAASVLHEGLVRGRGDDTLLGAYAVGLGLIGAEPSREVLREVVADDGRQPRLRGYAAVALGQIGGVGSDGRRVLNLALADHRFEVLRREAALALALLGGRVVGTQLLRELQGTGRTERMLGQVVEALGQLGDPRAVAALVEHASDAGRSELAQALGVVALGRIADPETRPSLLRLTRNANYPSRTEALHEVYTIL
jgi:HEAT repeat protein